MEGKFCSSCNQRLDENAFICKYCGTVNSGAAESDAKTGIEKRLGKGGLSIIIVLILIIIVAIVLMLK